MLSDSFHQALHYVLQNEGGFVCDKDDLGGATNCGITIGILGSWLNRTATIEELKRLKPMQIASIYNEFYWLPLSCNELTQHSIATAMFDVGVLFGVFRSGLFAQRAVKKAGFPEVEDDSRIGPVSVKALNSVDPKKFMMRYHVQIKNRINEIVAKRPISEKFENGWNNRADKLLLLV